MVNQRNLADMPGVEETLRQVTRAYRQGMIAPASAISDDINVTLPVPHWAEWSFVNLVGANYTAGQAVLLNLLTIPANERALLHSVSASRASGDNLVFALSVTFPADYGTGTRRLDLNYLTGGLSRMWWPDPGGEQSTFYGGPQGPVLLEPNSIIQLESDGTGVAASVFNVQILRTRMRLQRANAPDP